MAPARGHLLADSIKATILCQINASKLPQHGLASPNLTAIEAIVMTTVRTALLVLLCCVAVSACNTTGNVNDLAVRPAWIDNPGSGVSTSAGIHIRGRIAQEELAIHRAREEYAKRFGVKIDSSQTMSTTVAGGRSNTVGTQVSREELKQVEIKAEVKAKWRDPKTDVLWIWLVPSTQ